MLSKAKRLREFIRRIQAAPPAGSADEAFVLLAATLTAVEDEFSGVPSRPELWKSDGRMYPPQEDSRLKHGRPSVRKYRNKAHYVFIGLNGSVRVETLDAEVLIDKHGEDGRGAFDLDV